MPFDPAIVVQHGKDRIAARQVLVDRVGTPERQRLAALAQHEQAGGVIDLAVDQHDAGDRRIAQRPVRLQFPVTADLLEDVWRGVEQHPVGAAVGLDEDR